MNIFKKITYFKKLLLLIVATFPVIGFSYIQMQVSIVHEIGTDRNMVLKSELHSIEEIYENKNMSLRMQEGIRFDYSVRFRKKPESFGPTPYIFLKGSVYDHLGNHLKTVSEEEGFVKIGSSRTISFESEEGRRFEVVLKPEIRP